MVRKGNQSFVPADDMMLASGDGLLIIADDKQAVEAVAAKLGRLEPGRLVSDRSSLDYIRVFVGKASAVGIPLGQLPMPALVVHGSSDAITPLASSEKLAASLPHANLVVIDGAGHVPTVTRPDRVAAEIEKFFGAGGARLRQT